MVRQGVAQKLLTGTPRPMPLFLSTRAQKIIKNLKLNEKKYENLSRLQFQSAGLIAEGIDSCVF